MSVLQKRQGFEGYVNYLARDRGNQLWKILSPMMHTKTACDWEDLYTLMVEAHTLAQMMYSGADQYRFETPQGNQPFDKAVMVPKDPSLANMEDQLQARGARVKLGITPHVICKTSTPLGLVSETTILRAYVLMEAPAR